MNAQSIGESAKAIWHLLHGDNRKWEYQELKKATGLRDRELNAAIGWLACEGKIQFDESMQGQNTALYIELSYYIGTLSKILCKWKQDSVVSLFLYLNSVFKHKHKLIHNQAPV